METRDGTEIDEQNLVTTFQYLSYCVYVFNNLTADQIKRVMDHMGRDHNHTKYDSFICCILSHGGRNKNEKEFVCGSDNEEVVVSGTLSSMLSPANCPSLEDKPKLFFVQACRGDDEERPVSLSSSLRLEKSLRPVSPSIVKHRPS